MDQSTLTAPAEDDRHTEPRHVAIIMDGNGRWAQARGIPRSEGHRAGASAVRRAVEAAVREGVHFLTLYAFSSDNWKRPPTEVRHLMRLFRWHLRTEVEKLTREGVRLTVVGRRDRLSPDLVEAIGEAEADTRDGDRLHLQLAMDYSSRDVILNAARHVRGRVELEREDFRRSIARAMHADPDVPDVDLLIRTGGDHRLSDFLLWECAYAELVFTPCLWPDFDADCLASTLVEFRRRERRFGGRPGTGAIRRAGVEVHA